MLSSARSAGGLAGALAGRRCAASRTAICGAVVARGMPRPLAASRGIVHAESLGTVMRVDKEHWSAFMFGRERQLLIHVMNTAEEGDADGVMKAMDTFWSQQFAMEGTDSWSIRGDLIDKVVSERKPRSGIELGTYCGYSALRISRKLPKDGLLVSIELDPLFAAIATKIVEHAGLNDRVKILIGTVEQKLQNISDCFARMAKPGQQDKKVDFLLCDHSKDLFVPDLKRLEEAGLAGPGTVVMGDTTVYPGESGKEGGQELLSYFATNPKYRVKNHIGTAHTAGITVSEWVHLP